MFPQKNARHYRTVETQADRGVQGLGGQSTRVWSIMEKVDSKQILHALNDFWISYDRSDEGRTLGKIRADLIGKPAFAHFLTTLGGGKVLINDKVDDTLTLIRGNHKFDTVGYIGALPPVPKPLTSIHMSRVGDIPLSAPCPNPYKPLVVDQQRQHYRVVCEETGIPLQNITNYNHMFLAIFGCLEGIWYPW